MNKFFEYKDTPQWFHIRARATDIFMPDGKVITFWLWGDSKEHIKKLLKQGNNSYTDIEWIKQEKPDFI